MNPEPVEHGKLRLEVNKNTGEIIFTFGPGMPHLVVLAAQAIAMAIENSNHLAEESGVPGLGLCSCHFWEFAAILQGTELEQERHAE